MKKSGFSLLAAVALVCGLVGCQADTDTGQVDTGQTVQESQQIDTTSTTKQATEQTSKIIKTTAETTSSIFVTEEVSADIAVSREYEFDLDEYLERYDKDGRYSLKDELDFLNDKQYDTYIRALIFLDELEYLNIPYTGDIPTHWINDNGEITSSYYNKETNTYSTYKYISTYQSFYEYLQSIFTQDVVDEIMTNEFFKVVDDNLYFRFGEKGGAIWFQYGEYQLVEKNNDEVIFEYVAHQKNDEKEWSETHSLKLMRIGDCWQSEYFENLKKEF